MRLREYWGRCGVGLRLIRGTDAFCDFVNFPSNFGPGGVFIGALYGLAVARQMDKTQGILASFIPVMFSDNDRNDRFRANLLVCPIFFLLAPCVILETNGSKEDDDAGLSEILVQRGFKVVTCIELVPVKDTKCPSVDECGKVLLELLAGASVLGRNGDVDVDACRHDRAATLHRLTWKARICGKLCGSRFPGREAAKNPQGSLGITMDWDDMGAEPSVARTIPFQPSLSTPDPSSGLLLIVVTAVADAFRRLRNVIKTGSCAFQRLRHVVANVVMSSEHERIIVVGTVHACTSKCDGFASVASALV